jgi:hypothetical protein
MIKQEYSTLGLRAYGSSLLYLSLWSSLIRITWYSYVIVIIYEYLCGSFVSMNWIFEIVIFRLYLMYE